MLIMNNLRLWISKALILLTLPCASVLGAEPSIHVATTLKTSESGAVSTKDVFTRNGQTNLVRNTSIKLGVLQIRIHRFYHQGLLVGEFVAMPESSYFTTEAACPYSVGFQFGPTNGVMSAAISSKDGVMLDAFIATNGLFYPADVAIIGKANDIGGDVRKLLSPTHVTNTTPPMFQQEVEDLLEKHKEN
jgi:hypothetical protein